MRSEAACDCDAGWTGINCNVCTENQACNGLVDTGTSGVCYKNGEVVHHNHQICSVTNKKITDLLDEKRPEVTFTCQKNQGTCDFQCKLYTLSKCLLLIQDADALIGSLG